MFVWLEISPNVFLALFWFVFLLVFFQNSPNLFLHLFLYVFELIPPYKPVAGTVSLNLSSHSVTALSLSLRSAADQSGDQAV